MSDCSRRKNVEEVESLIERLRGRDALIGSPFDAGGTEKKRRKSTTRGDLVPEEREQGQEEKRRERKNEMEMMMEELLREKRKESTERRKVDEKYSRSLFSLPLGEARRQRQEDNQNKGR